MSPTLPLANAPYSLLRYAESSGYSGRRLSRCATGSDHWNIGFGQLGVYVVRSPLSTLGMLARSIGISASQTLRVAQSRIGLSGSWKPAFGCTVSDILLLRAKPQMRRITTRRTVADMKHANACRTELGFVGKRSASRKLIGNPMREADLSVPLHLAVAVLGACSSKWPASVWRANRYAAPEAFRGDVHGLIFEEAA